MRAYKHAKYCHYSCTRYLLYHRKQYHNFLKTNIFCIRPYPTCIKDRKLQDNYLIGIKIKIYIYIFITASMTAIEKIYNFTNNITQIIGKNTQAAFDNLYNQLQNIQLQSFDNSIRDSHAIEQSIIQNKQHNFDTGEKKELNQQKDISVEDDHHNNKAQVKDTTEQKAKSRKIRVKQIQDQKKRIAQQLRMLDQQIQQINGKNTTQNLFKKHTKIHRDESAQKHAQILVRQLKNQRKQIQNRKKQEFQKSLLEMQKQEEQRRKIRQQEALRIKQERRLAIIQRMQQQKKKKEQRKLIQMQSNQLIVKLKKQEQLQKMALIAPSQVYQAEQKKKIVQKKNNFNLQQIEEHDRKYQQLKIKSKKQKQQRAQSLKINKQYASHKYSRNVWIQRIQQQEQRKKQQQRQLQQKRKNQLEKRLKYGQLVKNIFLPKKKQKDNDSGSVQKQGIRQSQHENPIRNSSKPRTPQEVPTLPKVKSNQNRTQHSKLHRQQSKSNIKNLRSQKQQHKQQIKQFNQNEEEKQRLKKIREQQMRKQTKQRLKKLQSQGLNKAASQQDRVKYKNYLGQVKIKKDEANQWKKIINSDKLTQQQKYQQIIKKAGDLEAKARKRQDKGAKKDADQDTVNLYIGSIQAKLALLQKF